VAPQFFGRYEHSLDPKGRIVLPARFRLHFGTQAFLSQYFDGCLALWTPDEFAKRLEALLAAQGRSAADRQMARVWAGGSQEVEIDKQGRLALPQHLREFAGLETAVLIMGALERVELWNPALWETRIRPAEDSLTNPQDEALAAVSAAGTGS
jgi:MraZ protein